MNLETLEHLDDQDLKDQEERMVQRVQLENLDLLDNKVCQDWLVSRVHLDPLDLQVHLEKARLWLNLFPVAIVCLDPLELLDPWEVLDHLVNVELLEEGDLKVQLVCLEFLVVQEVLVELDPLVSRAHQENQERTENQDENIARMTFEKFAHRCCVIASLN